MSAFDPPSEPTWCPDCARERITCAHQGTAALTTDGGKDDPTCDYRDCDRAAIALYEGTRPPANSFRFYSCRRHEPDMDPIREVDN